ncbi:MAG: hypothetical protein AAGE96_17635, partial [Cyanobacteria bacterium P01_G01_bin.19]
KISRINLRMIGYHNRSGKLIITIAVALNIGLVNNNKALANTVEVSGGGECQGDITASDLNGKVVCTYGNGDCEASRRHRFEGQFVNGQKHGSGVYTFADGARVEGTWENDEYQ